MTDKEAEIEVKKQFCGLVRKQFHIFNCIDSLLMLAQVFLLFYRKSESLLPRGATIFEDLSEVRTSSIDLDLLIGFTPRMLLALCMFFLQSSAFSCFRSSQCEFCGKLSGSKFLIFSSSLLGRWTFRLAVVKHNTPDSSLFLRDRWNFAHRSSFATMICAISCELRDLDCSGESCSLPRYLMRAW